MSYFGVSLGNATNRRRLQTMSVRFIQQNFVKYNKGKGFLCCHVDAQHAAPPESDLFTDNIAAQLIAQTGCAGIIGTISRTKADLNRKPDGKNNEALQEYRSTINDILLYLDILDNTNHRVTKPYLHLTIHGMKDIHYGPYGIEIGTLHGQSCSPEVRAWFQKMLVAQSQELFPQLNIIFDHKFAGNDSILFHRLGDGDNHRGYGPNFHTFQIELARTLREDYQSEIVELFSRVIIQFQEAFVHQK